MLSKAKIAQIRSLHQKKERLSQGLFITEGEKLVKELLQSHFSIEGVYYSDACSADLSWHIQKAEVKSQRISERELEQISALQTANAVLAVVKIPEPEEVVIPLADQFYLALEGIRDPGNLGTIIRIADWFGIKQIFLSPDCVELYNPKVIQSTMGSFIRVKVHYVELPVLMQENKHLPCYGTLLEGENLYHCDLKEKGFILIGSESHGISEELIRFIDQKITIPRYGGAESLNAGIATALVCSEFRRRFPLG